MSSTYTHSPHEFCTVRHINENPCSRLSELLSDALKSLQEKAAMQRADVFPADHQGWRIGQAFDTITSARGHCRRVPDAERCVAL